MSLDELELIVQKLKSPYAGQIFVAKDYTKQDLIDELTKWIKSVKMDMTSPPNERIRRRDVEAWREQARKRVF